MLCLKMDAVSENVCFVWKWKGDVVTIKSAEFWLKMEIPDPAKKFDEFVQKEESSQPELIVEENPKDG